MSFILLILVSASHPSPILCQEVQPIVLPEIDPERTLTKHKTDPQISESVSIGIHPDLQKLYRVLQQSSFDYARKKVTSDKVIEISDGILPLTPEQKKALDQGVAVPHNERPSYYIRNNVMRVLGDAEYGYRHLQDSLSVAADIIPNLKSELESSSGATVDITHVTGQNIGLALQMDAILDHLVENPKAANTLKGKKVVFVAKPGAAAKISHKLLDNKVIEVVFDTENLDLLIDQGATARKDDRSGDLSQSHFVVRSGAEGQIQLMEYISRYKVSDQSPQSIIQTSSSGAAVYNLDREAKKLNVKRIGQTLVTDDLIKKFFR